MKLLLPILLLFSTSILLAGEQEEMNTLFELTCFNGKLDSGSKCSTTTKMKEDGKPLTMSGALTCGYPGFVSKITWEWKVKEESVFIFTRIFPVDSDSPQVFQKEITYEGKRVILFEDEHQVITIGPGQPKA